MEMLRAEKSGGSGLSPRGGVCGADLHHPGRVPVPILSPLYIPILILYSNKWIFAT
jgi:hypothetical protein